MTIRHRPRRTSPSRARAIAAELMLRRSEKPAAAPPPAPVAWFLVTPSPTGTSHSILHDSKLTDAQRKECTKKKGGDAIPLDASMLAHSLGKLSAWYRQHGHLRKVRVRAPSHEIADTTHLPKFRGVE